MCPLMTQSTYGVININKMKQKMYIWEKIEHIIYIFLAGKKVNSNSSISRIICLRKQTIEWKIFQNVLKPQCNQEWVFVFMHFPIYSFVGLTDTYHFGLSGSHHFPTFHLCHMKYRSFQTFLMRVSYTIFGKKSLALHIRYVVLLYT